jgi:CheY-like chemotaxis protein
VLVVEDNLDSAQSLAELIELWGHEVRVALDGPAALEAAKEYKPEVVLLDLGLPFVDGFEVARRLRQDPKLARAQLVALTGYHQEEDRRRSRDAGFDLHLTKPIDCDHLARLLSGAEPAHSTERRERLDV